MVAYKYTKSTFIGSGGLNLLNNYNFAFTFSQNLKNAQGSIFHGHRGFAKFGKYSVATFMVRHWQIMFVFMAQIGPINIS